MGAWGAPSCCALVFAALHNSPVVCCCHWSIFRCKLITTAYWRQMALFAGDCRVGRDEPTMRSAAAANQCFRVSLTPRTAGRATSSQSLRTSGYQSWSTISLRLSGPTLFWPALTYVPLEYDFLPKFLGPLFLRSQSTPGSRTYGCPLWKCKTPYLHTGRSRWRDSRFTVLRYFDA
jgi:hypothetical protein